MDLKNLVYGIYGLINYKRTDVFAEYEKIPVKDHDDIYIVTSIENISLKNQFIKSSLKRYETLIDLKVRILGRPDEDPLVLYEYMDNAVISRLASGGYYLKSAEIKGPKQDNGLKRFVLEGIFTLEAKSEAEI